MNLRCVAALPLILIVYSACGPTESGIDEPTSPLVGIEITPLDSEVTIRDGAETSVEFTAMASYEDGTSADVSDVARFSISDAALGVFATSRFDAAGLSAGVGTVTVGIDGASASTSLTVRIDSTRIEGGAPPDSPSLFDAATADPGLAPAIVYPAAETLVPPNLGDFETHWTATGQTDLFRVRLSTAYTTTTVYSVGTIEAAGRWQGFSPSEWTPIGSSAGGEEMIVDVAGLAIATPQTLGETSVAINLASEAIDGGIYYWASSGSQPAGIYRHDMSRPGTPAEAFYTTGETPSNRCVACHVISRDGTTMAVTFDGGNTAANTAAAGIVDIETRALMSPNDQTMRWNFAAFTPDGSELLTVLDGVMTLREPSTGAVISTVDAGAYATHPEFSPSGDRLVYVEVATPGVDWAFTGGSIVVRDYAPAIGFGPPTTIAIAPPANFFYPSWSPDGQWVVFNSSTENAYDNATAELFVTKADGSGTPIKLDSPNITSGLTNSWARFAPFAQTEGGEPLNWLTFSSKRAFGVRLPMGQPQIWMAPLFPDRIGSGDPSGPAFWLPFQELGTNNHIAQWTEQVIVD